MSLDSDRVLNIREENFDRRHSFDVEQFHPGFFIEYQSRRRADGKAPATINRETEVIRAILNFSYRSRRIPSNPSIGAKKLKLTNQKTDFWEPSEAEKFLSFAKAKYAGTADQRVYVVYLLALNTGMRAGEIWGLRPEDVDKSFDLIFVQRQYDRVAKAFRTTKGKKSRYVPCGEDLARELKGWMAKRPDAETLFAHESGGPVCHEVFVRRYFDRDVKAAGLKSIRFHDLRHTAITFMIAHDINLSVVKEICGHQSITTTMGYVHLLADSVRKVGRTFSVRAA